MQIQFERSGGFGGLRLATTVETSTLPEEEAQAVEQELQAANFFDLPAQIPSTGADQFQYLLTVRAGDSEHTVEVGESALPEELRPLVQRLSRLARRARR